MQTIYGLTPVGPAPTQRHMEWYRREKIAFIHFTVNTFTDLEWGDGTETAEAFAPTELDCRQWARVLKEGGFSAAILTAKHHDGFCLWPSAYTEHSVKNSPIKRDVVREFIDACREFGLKPGLYISPWDRNHPLWGTDAYSDYYAKQLTELMTGYGKIWECWWDGAGSTETRYDWARWADIVRTNQPDCLIFGSMGATDYVDVRWVGNESGRAGENCWATIHPQSLFIEVPAELNTGDPEGSRFIPAETNVSIRPGWFYHASQDDRVMDEEELVGYWFRSAGRNTTILLNLPPDRRGLIPEKDALAVKNWNIRMQEIFRENLAEKGTFREAPGAQNLLNPHQDAIYVAEKNVLQLDFPEEIRFDCFRLDEVIELGHRIRGFRLEALTEDGWTLLEEKEAVGFCRASRFPQVQATSVRLTITASVATPVLRFFGLYRGATPRVTKRTSYPAEPPIASLKQEENTVYVELRGIYPYNCVECSAARGQVWQVHAFNGTRYEKIAETSQTRCTFPTQTGSYRLKIITEGPVDSEMPFRILYQAE